MPVLFLLYFCILCSEPVCNNWYYTAALSSPVLLERFALHQVLMLSQKHKHIISLPANTVITKRLSLFSAVARYIFEDYYRVFPFSAQFSFLWVMQHLLFHCFFRSHAL